ncbi:hypothetical protein [Neobacillus vireti]|uniref:hypothetical protein n=1 Tax=Neobacillus vireti TaxID=220686 RepID=UPI002FFE39FB
MGISISDYNDMTPYELSVAIMVFNEKSKNEMEEKLFVAYHSALWQRVDKLSINNLKEVLDNLNGKVKNKEMTPEEMLEKVKMLNAAFNGEVKSNGNSS